MPAFSVIIPTYNRFATVRRAIDSVLSQTFTDYELIVIDDGSTDETGSLPGIYGDRIIYRAQENRGVSAARNAGIVLARSELLAFLDSDDEWLPGKLEAQISFQEKNPALRLHQCDEIWIRRGRRVNPRDRHRKIGGNIFADSLRLCLISPSAVVVHRSLFESYGTFDEDLPACEDYDLWLRLAWREESGLLPSALVVRHAGHMDQLSAAHWGMDRFRVYSIIKLLEKSGIEMGSKFAAEAKGVALDKLAILIGGAEKRSRDDYARRLSEIRDQVTAGVYNSKGCRILLER